MSQLTDSNSFSINALTMPLVHSLIENASMLSLAISTLDNGVTIVDAGINVNGGIEAGRRIAEICLGGLGTVNLRASIDNRDWSWCLDVHTSQPILSCLGSQYAGWSLSHGQGKDAFNALCSGPGRSIGSKEAIFSELSYRDQADETCLIIEADCVPPIEITEQIAQQCGISTDRLILIITPTSSLCGDVQIVARVLETAMHKVHALGFDLHKIIDGAGSAPICPPAKDSLTAMGRTNDAILFGGQVHLFVRADDQAVEQLTNKLPSSASSDYGKPFAKVFKDAGYDFYQIDPLLFSPAKVTVTALDSGNTFHAGKIDLPLLTQSFANSDSG